jgi:tagatose-6-phosphate ketose/aldose isomerase
LAELSEEKMPVLDILFGQPLAFFRCLKEGLKPDAPLVNGVIHRVVQEFTMHNV